MHFFKKSTSLYHQTQNPSPTTRPANFEENQAKIQNTNECRKNNKTSETAKSVKNHHGQGSFVLKVSDVPSECGVIGHVKCNSLSSQAFWYYNTPSYWCSWWIVTQRHFTELADRTRRNDTTLKRGDAKVVLHDNRTLQTHRMCHSAKTSFSSSSSICKRCIHLFPTQTSSLPLSWSKTIWYSKESLNFSFFCDQGSNQIWQPLALAFCSVLN